MKKFSLLILIIFISARCYSQIELSLGSSYEIPMDELKWIYKSAPNYQISIHRGDKYKSHRTSVGITLGYAKLPAKQDTFYYLLNEEEFGTISYSDYQILQLTASFRKDLALGKHLELFYGVEAGVHQTVYKYSSADPYTIEDAEYNVSRIPLIPRIGFNLLLTENISCYIQGRYTLSMSVTENQSDNFNHFLSPGTGLNIRF